MIPSTTLAAALLVLATAVPALAADAPPAKSRRPVVGAEKSCGSQWWRTTALGGRLECGAAGKPAVLLVHGLHQGEWNWTAPATHDMLIYDYDRPPKTIRATKESPGVGVFKIGKSDTLSAAAVNADNYFDLLRGHGFTVATWTQDGPRFEAAYRSAVTAYKQFAADTAALNPASPAPIALVAHSRGGLVVRRLLKEHEKDMARVRWVITLHTPHYGSEMARAASHIVAEVTDLVGPLPLPQKAKEQLRDLAVEAARPLNKFVTEHGSAGDESRELMPGGPLFRSLEKGEKALPHVRYHTFGGTNSRYYRLYTWIFTPESAVPQFRGIDKYFKWEARPVEVAGFSPMLDKLRDIVQEIKPGKGDGLVTDTSARLSKSVFPNAVHVTNRLNHAEVLWDRGVQHEVLRILSSH